MSRGRINKRGAAATPRTYGHPNHDALMRTLRSRGLATSHQGRDFFEWTYVELVEALHAMAPELVPASKKPKITIIEILLAAQDSGHALQEPRPVLRESKNGRYDQMGATASGLGTARAPWSGMRDVSSLLRPSIAPPNWLFLSPLPTSLKGEESLMRLCEVCLSTLPVDAFHQSPKNSDCHHEASTCNNCLGEYIQSVSVSTALDAIPCPEVSCNAFLSYYQMKNHAAPDSFQRYDAKLRQDFLASSNDYTKCARPDCLDGGFFDGDDSYIICPCGANTCIACKTIWHPGVTHQENLEAIRVAEEQRERDQQSSLHEIATKKYIKARAKICPKCSSPIVKNKGCDHMTCKSRTGKGVVCGYEFCYACLANFGPIRRQGNHKHKASCKHWFPPGTDVARRA